jgi:hypothetical protein
VFTAAKTIPAPAEPSGSGRVLGWYPHDWFVFMKAKDTARWRAATSRLVDELGKRGVMKRIKRPETWAPVAPVRHDAWGKSFARFYNERMRKHRPNMSLSYDERKKVREEAAVKNLPSIRREYKRFIDSMSDEQLVRHKQLVLESGDREYWVTPRWQNWDGREGLEEPLSSPIDHPRMPKRHQF